MFNLKDLKCVSDNVDLNDYYKLYNNVRVSMEHPEWLELIPRIETEKILKNGGKIWLYYDNDNLVCSMFYIPSNNKSLMKHNVNYDESIVGSLGPIMVDKKYQGNNLMNQMMLLFDEYNIKVGNKYIFTKAVTENIYSIRNIEKNNYILVHKYMNERGMNSAYIKDLNIK